jgi:hypothetical protein
MSSPGACVSWVAEGPREADIQHHDPSGSQQPDGRITDEELEALVQRTEEATSAFMRGDMDRLAALRATLDECGLSFRS